MNKITESLEKAMKRKGCKCHHCNKKSHNFKITENTKLKVYSTASHGDVYTGETVYVDLICPTCGNKMTYYPTSREYMRCWDENEQIKQKKTYANAMAKKGIIITDLKPKFKLSYIPVWIWLCTGIITICVISIIFVDIFNKLSGY